jgi:hypothetical protein
VAGQKRADRASAMCSAPAEDLSHVDSRVDRPHNVGLRTSMRWNPRAEWFSSPKTAHPAIVNAEEFDRAQHTRAVRRAAGSGGAAA